MISLEFLSNISCSIVNKTGLHCACKAFCILFMLGRIENLKLG